MLCALHCNRFPRHRLAGADERWFFLVTVAMEHRGAEALTALQSAYAAMEVGEEEEAVLKSLGVIAEVLSDLRTLLLRMREGCKPEVCVRMCVRVCARVYGINVVCRRSVGSVGGC